MNVTRQIMSRVASSIVNRNMISHIGVFNRLLTQASMTSFHSVKNHSIFALGNQRFSSTSTCAKKLEVINVQDETDFKKRVIEASSSMPVVVDFHATWCGPCKLLGPRLETILAEEGNVIMAKVDIDENSELAMEYKVRSVPTVMGMKNGKVLNQFIGSVDDDQIRTFVKKLVCS